MMDGFNDTSEPEEPPRAFNTLRGFIAGDEPDEAPYFAYSATLQIFGEALDFELISQKLCLSPSAVHRKGEARGKIRPVPYKEDMWTYSAGLPEEKPLEEHINALWHDIRHAKEFLLEFKKLAKVDVFLGYRSNIDWAGIEVPHTSLEMFRELEIPFGLSIIVG